MARALLNFGFFTYRSPRRFLLKEIYANASP